MLKPGPVYKDASDCSCNVQTLLAVIRAGKALTIYLPVEGHVGRHTGVKFARISYTEIRSIQQTILITQTIKLTQYESNDCQCRKSEDHPGKIRPEHK